MMSPSFAQVVNGQQNNGYGPHSHSPLIGSPSKDHDYRSEEVVHMGFPPRPCDLSLVKHCRDHRQEATIG
ncbi:hypothetical protein GOP47_0003060 [Adiantum capillus-veneris]|uniref:Uncharacterized protein n=1 Tax=Adiantum capillus-veneris TaxID=13818 RepID=A0A9D4ZRW5_ADICA|nr:hypothetical protein GOP47_0003060 [Adiantum capillus-veneris]